MEFANQTDMKAFLIAIRFSARALIHFPQNISTTKMDNRISTLCRNDFEEEEKNENDERVLGCPTIH